MITIERNALRAVAEATAGTGASRPPLAGVLLEVIGGKIVGVATNGHILMASEVGQVSEKDDKLPPKMWLSCNTLKVIGPGKTRLIIDYFNNDLYLKSFGPVDVRGYAVDYPDWRAVFPEKINNEPAQYDPRYIYAFHTAYCKLMGLPMKSTQTPLMLTHNGPRHAGIVRFQSPAPLRELFVGLIMPLRVTNNDTEETHHCLPSWLNRR